MSGSVRLGIVGSGIQGSNYARLLAGGAVPNLHVAAVADTDPARRQLSADLYPDVPVFDDHLSMLHSGEIDAIVTTVPHYVHPQVAIDALARGIHVLVEKPAGVFTKQVRELNEFASARPELTFAIMFNQRANPLFRRLRQIVADGEIGAIRRTNWIITTWYRPQAYYSSSPWRATWGGEGGGVLVNQAPHNLDLWQWICGVPRSVFAKVGFGFRRDIAVEDEVTVVVDYGDGVTGTFITATHDLVGTDRLEILGDQGKIVVENSQTAVVTRFRLPERQISEAIPGDEIWKFTSSEFDAEDLYSVETIRSDSAWGGQHAAVFANFAANILDGTPLLAPGSDGMSGVRLANAIHLSAWTGHEVSMDFDEDEFLALLNAKIEEEGKFARRY